MTHEIHISDVRAFRSCRRRWHWSSRLRENLERIYPYAPFFTGKAIHAALEFFYVDRQSFEATLSEYLEKEWANVESLGNLWPEEKEKLEEQIDLIYALLDHYRLWVDQDDRAYSDRNLEFVDTEVSWELPLPGFEDVVVAGRFDAVVRHRKTGKIWIFETKTTRSIKSFTETLILDEQCTLYTWAAQQVYGADAVGGVLYNLMRKKAPTSPTTLRDGSLSRAKSIDTTTYHYRKFLKDMFPDWSEELTEEMYGDVLFELENKNKDYFMRFPVVRSQQQIEQFMYGLTQTAHDMLNPHVRIYPAPNWISCAACTFKSPCIAMSQGQNYQVLLDAEYQVRESATSMRPDKEEDENDD